MPTASSQLQQPLQGTGFPHMSLQQPLPPKPRPPSVPTFHPQHPLQIGANLGFQHASAPHNLPQSIFHGQTPLPSQQPAVTLSGWKFAFRA